MEENAAAKQPMLLRLNGEEEKDDEDEEEASSATTPSSSSRKSTTVDASESRDRVYESWFREEVNMALPQKVVLLCCGSFNPITNMHLRMFELARDALDATGRYKVVGGIISPVNDAYTKPSLVSAKHRSTMIRLALQTSDWIKLDTWESEQESWLETLKVLKHHRESIESAFNANPPPDTPTKKRKLNSNMSPADEVDFSASSFNLNEGMPRIKLLCGADLLSSFAEPGLWKDQDIEEIVGKYGIVCITRANAVNPENFIYDSDVLTLHRENIHIVTEWIHNEISSTKIRRALSRSKSIKYLVQDPVIEYIKENRLYSKSTLDNNRRAPSPFNEHDHNRDIRRLQHQPYSYQDDHDAITTARCLSVEPELRQALRSQSLDAEAKPRCHRRHLNLDEEQRRHRSTDECHETKQAAYRKTFSFDSIEANGRVRHVSGGPSRENSLDSMDYNKKRLGYRRQDSVESGERPPLYKQADSIDSVNSERSSTIRSPLSPSRPVTSCMGMADISGLMRRVRGMRVAVTPETCV